MLTLLDIQTVFYNAYKRILTIQEFERWLYENDSIENVIGKDLYLNLVSINYREKDAFSQLEKMIYPLIPFDKMETIRIMELLRSLIEGNVEDVFRLMSTSYNDYCNGYSFFRYLGLSFITSGVEEHIGIEGVRKNLLLRIDNYKREAKRLISFLENRQLIIVDEHEYQDNRKNEDRIELNDIESMFN